MAVGAGDVQALKALSELLQRDYSRAPDVCASLLAYAREGGFHLCAVRGLRLASASMSDHAVWRTSSQLLSYLDPQLRPPPATPRRGAPGPRAAAALAAARESEHAKTLALLGQVVAGAAPLFRRVRPPHDVLEPLREPPFPQLLAELAQLFGTQHEGQLSRSGDNAVEVISVQPASILVGDRTPRDLASARFRLARAFEAARAENVLLSALARDSAEVLLAALPAAFGPPDARAQVSREAAGLAAELWRTIPAGAQRTVTRLVLELGSFPDYGALVSAVQLRSARVALFVTRDLEHALAQLGLDGDPKEAQVGGSEEELEHALSEQPLARDLVRYAFSDAYLRALADAP